MRKPRLRFREFLLVTLLISLLTATYSIRQRTWRREESGEQSSSADRARISANGLDGELEFAKKRLESVPAISEEDVSKFDVALMFEASDMRDLPKKGKDLVVVANLEGIYFFRAFDGQGKIITTWAQTLPEPLDLYIQGLLPPHEMTRREKDRVVGIFAALLEEGKAEYQGIVKSIEVRKASELAQAERLDRLARQP